MVNLTPEQRQQLKEKELARNSALLINTPRSLGSPDGRRVESRMSVPPSGFCDHSRPCMSLRPRW